MHNSRTGAVWALCLKLPTFVCSGNLWSWPLMDWWRRWREQGNKQRGRKSRGHTWRTVEGDGWREHVKGKDTDRSKWKRSTSLESGVIMIFPISFTLQLVFLHCLVHSYSLHGVHVSIYVLLAVWLIISQHLSNGAMKVCAGLRVAQRNNNLCCEVE